MLRLHSLTLAAGNSSVVHVTFASAMHRVDAALALNWAALLHAAGTRSLIGLASLPTRPIEQAATQVGATLFCADGDMMRQNGQAGRWAEAAKVLALAARLGSLSVLVSDADVGWVRNPAAYLAAASSAHPRAAFMLLTDRVTNDYSATRLPGRPSELELEPADSSGASFNIGIVFFCAHAMRALEAMVHRWVVAVGGGREVRLPFARAGLAAWDQGAINDAVLRLGLRTDTADTRLLLVDGGRLSMGVLPMLQFANCLTYFVHRSQREVLGVKPFALHAVYAHGRSDVRKRAVLKEARLWRLRLPAPRDRAQQRYLTFTPVVSAAAAGAGGFALLLSQLDQVLDALRLSLLLNRTLVLPRLFCGDGLLSYPCAAW